jgi:hypothetical protein
MKDETLLLNDTTLNFREEYPELIKKWEKEIANDVCNPDLHYCLYALEDFINLKAHLIQIEYQIDFAINAHIIHANWQRDFVQVGHSDSEAIELASKEILEIYTALNELPLDGKAKILAEILDKEFNR